MSDVTQHESQPQRHRGGFTKEMRAARAATLAAQQPQPARQSDHGLAGDRSDFAPLPNATSVSAGVTADAGLGDAPRVNRSTRRPFGSTQQKLAYPARPGYYRHWFNDNPGRIEFATEESGWTHVKDARGKNVQRVVGVREGGVPQIAYLLEIPEEWHADDMVAQEEDISTREDAIRRGMVSAKNAVDQQRFYPTSSGREIKISTSRR